MKTALLACLLTLEACAMADEVILHVSLDGGPLATPIAARDAARPLLAAGHAVTIELAGGTYELPEPLVLDERDSGATWRSKSGERAVLSGGSSITGWEPSGQGFPEGVMRARVEPGRRFHQLWAGSSRRQRARIPNRGYLRARQLREKGFYYEGDDLSGMPRLTEDGIIFMLHLWESSAHWVESVDEAAAYVDLTSGIAWGGHYPPWEAHRRYWIEGAREGLDEAGEWWLDPREGWLHYWPLPGEDLSRVNVVAPRLAPTLLVLDGKPEDGSFVQGVRFEGLVFAHAGAEMPREGRGVTQAAVAQAAAVMVTGARECVFVGCEIAHAGEHGLWLRRGSQDCRLERCHIHDLGAGGVRIGEGETAPSEAEAVERITVENCYIHDGALLFAGGPGVGIGRSSHNTIRHCEISDFLHIGISIGWQWGYQPPTAHHNLIEFNRVHHIGHGVLSDMGAIYTLSESPGTVLRGNVIHDVLCYPKYYNGHLAKGLGDGPTEGSGIYLDEGTTRVLVEGNVVYDVNGSAYHINYGHTNEVTGNVFGLSPTAVWINHAQDFASMLNLAGNVLAPLSEHAFIENAPATLDASDNLWVVPEDVTPLFAGKPFSAWQAQGRDVDGRVVQEALPASQEDAVKRLIELGGERLELAAEAFATAGLVGDAEWTALPGKYPPRRDDEIPSERPSEFFIEDFEKVSLGSKPFRSMHAVPEQTELAVTDEQAASGSQSLKVTDGPGQPSFCPHWAYEPTVRDGVVRIAFDLMLPSEGACAISLEARDWSQHAYRTAMRVAFAPDGTVTAGGRTVGKLPLGEWAHVACTLGVGPAKEAGFEVVVQSEDGNELRASGPVSDGAFEVLTWLGFSAEGEEAGTCYIDNLEVAGG